MDPRELEGRRYGPFALGVCREKVRELVEATGDEPGRWTEAAPPAFAAVALFAVASDLLAAVSDRMVVHGEQTFAWHAPFAVESVLSVTGTVGRMRERGDTSFCTFELAATDGVGGAVLEGRSLFLISPRGGPSATTEPEPPPGGLGVGEPPLPLDPPEAGAALPPLHRTVSRAGLVRYAGATRDWNPIHWDHEAAVAAGLPGVVVHGLLQSAWLCQAATRLSRHPAPLATARFRYRAPLRPSVEARVEGRMSGEDAVELALIAAGSTVTTGMVEVRRSP